MPVRGGRKCSSSGGRASREVRPSGRPCSAAIGVTAGAGTEPGRCKSAHLQSPRGLPHSLRRALSLAGARPHRTIHGADPCARGACIHTCFSTRQLSTSYRRASIFSISSIGPATRSLRRRANTLPSTLGLGVAPSWRCGLSSMWRLTLPRGTTTYGSAFVAQQRN